MKDNEVFKKEMRDSIIPAVKLMLIKENAHWHWLNNRPNIYDPQISLFKIESQMMIGHLKERLQEYENYVK